MRLLNGGVTLAKARVLFAVALLFTNFASTASMQTRGRGILAGELRGNSGESVQGGKVKLMLKSSDPLETTSDKDGRWKVMGIGKGEWTMLVTAPGYAPRVIRIVVERESENGEPLVTILRKMTINARN
jgi:hypothetical protein